MRAALPSITISVGFQGLELTVHTYLSRVGLFLFVTTAPVAGLMAQSISRGPYLQMGTEDSIVIRWRTDVATDSEVRYGLAFDALPNVVSNPATTTEHELTLSSLLPDTQYFYSVGTTAGALAGGDESHSFVTSPTPGTPKPTRIWVLGDSGTANANAAAVRNAFLNYTGSWDPDLWLMLGDNAYPDGTDSQYQSAVFDMYPSTLRKAALWPTLGNHDGHTADSATQTGPYYDIFTLPTSAQAGGLASGTEAYYSFDYGNIHFICIESYETDRSLSGAMMTWLSNDILATNKEWIIAFWHHPPYSKGSHDSDTEGTLMDMRENALPILESGGVDLVLSGHSHSYERSFLIDGHYGTSDTLVGSMILDAGDGREGSDGAYVKPFGQGTPNEGAVYAVAGSSGKVSGVSQHPAMFIWLSSLGSMVLDVYGNRLDARFLDSTGAEVDEFTMLKGQDTLPPAVISAAALGATSVSVLYAEPVESVSSSDPSNYAIDQGITVTGATLQADGRTVVLTTTSLSSGVSYVLTINGVLDLAGNAIPANTQESFDFIQIITIQFQDGVLPTAGYWGTRDTYISENNPATNFGSSGVLLADGDDPSTSGLDLSSLMAWQISDIPSNAVVEAAFITLDVTNRGGVYRLYQALQPWLEDEATWNDHTTGLPWEVAGAEGPNDRGSQVLGDISAAAVGIQSFALNSDGVAVVQGWVDGSIPNLGFILTDGSSSDGLDFLSREELVATRRPLLSLDYSVPPWWRR